MDTLYISLAWAVGLIALFSFLAVNSWLNNNRREREAYYRSEAIKKIAEMQGNAPESVLNLLREALAPTPEAPNPMIMTSHWRKEREAYYRAEAVKKLAESQGTGTDAMLQYLREEERKADRRKRAGLRLAGLITFGVGIGVTVFLYVMDPVEGVYLAGLIPTLVGLALLTFSFMAVDNSMGMRS
jgi:ferric-dicitrate binding protein FerR (iron transport regulator)